MNRYDRLLYRATHLLGFIMLVTVAWTAFKTNHQDSDLWVIGMLMIIWAEALKANWGKP